MTAHPLQKMLKKIFIYIDLYHISRRWKQLKWSSVDEWRNKVWSIHTMEYYSVLKRMEILTRATTWMYFEDIVLNEISPTRKDNYCMSPPI